MGHILQKFESNEALPRVQVLLGTYNGGKYLKEFLESLRTQSGVKIDLLVSDDGSTDNTFEVLNSFKTSFNSFHMIDGPRLGAAENYFHLLQHSAGDFVAFADQDDIWNIDHLSLSIERLKNFSDSPAASFCSVSEFNSDHPERVKVWPKRIDLSSPFTMLVENQARGCTLVINKPAADLLKQVKPEMTIMHDWWVALTILLVGNLVYSETPEINYRIHSNNTIGGTPPFSVRFSKLLRNRVRVVNWPPMEQLREIYTDFGVMMEPLRRKEIEYFIHCGQSSNFLLRAKVAFTKHKLRLNPFDDLMVRLIIFFNGFHTQGYLVKSAYVFLRRNIANLYYNYFSEIPIAARSFINVKMTHNSNHFDIVKEKEILKGKVAVLVFYPRGSLIDSNLRLLDALLKNQYQVILVMNESKDIDTWIEKLKSLPITIIKRPNMGRDFGAYQCGFRYLMNSQRLSNISKVLMANDSIVYGGNFSDFFAKYEQDPHPWVSAFINFEKHTHAQSFFQSFTGEILHLESFQNFWRNYYPSDRRIHAIDNGEVKLSRTLIDSGYFPSTIITAKSLINSLGNSRLRDADLIAMNKSLGITKKSKKRNLNLHQKISRIFVEKNVTHALGMLCSIYLGAPLKLDLIVHRKATQVSIRDTLLKMQIEPVEVEKLLIDYGPDNLT